jgi:undecaprenyl-diphosphatase
LNSYALALLLGIVEGITEFLPVSSTAHLRIAEEYLGLSLSDPYWKMFSIVIQLGAILVLPIYFRARLWKFFTTFPHGEEGRSSVWEHPLTLTAVAWLVTAVPAFLLTKVIGKNLESLTVIGASLLIGGLVMWVVDSAFGAPKMAVARSVGAAASGYRTDCVEEMTLWQSIWIGACQVLSAVFPGTSRSMATIAAGQVTGMSRPAALEFSFLLSIPTMLAATGYTMLKSLRSHSGAPAIFSAPVDAQGWIVLAIGFAASFVVAYAVVAWFMHWVRQHGFVPFAVYRILFGLVVLWWALGKS